MTHQPLPIQRGFGETLRRDLWWVSPLIVFLSFSAFLVYGTWAAFQNAYYTYGPYLSPFYSPEIWGDSHWALLGPKPGWWPTYVPFSPALLILPIPGLFRFTCYYYRGAYYKGFWADPANCAVGEARKVYRGEKPMPNALQNLHRYSMYLVLVVMAFLAYDAWEAFWWLDMGGNVHFGAGLGTVIMWANLVLLSGYTFGCHSVRHIVGGFKDRLSGQPIRAACYSGCSRLNAKHGSWARWSMFSVGFTDIYIRLCAMGYITDWRIF
ncbi:MAG: succinate dehydrogenase [Gemmatimonadetes bacterium]|nr:succinate dehydrogenase [Gemmatimonadota bacterium]